MAMMYLRGCREREAILARRGAVVMAGLRAAPCRAGKPLQEQHDIRLEIEANC
jgi:hypothetical protein